MFLETDILFDSHCHLNDASFAQDREGVVRAAMDAGVGAIVDIGVSVEASEQALADSQRFPGTVFSTVGIDPEILIPGSNMYIGVTDKAEVQILRRLILQNPRSIIAVGEIGMDKYWIDQQFEEKKMTLEDYNRIVDAQQELFGLQLQLASAIGLPVSVHSRGAEQECLDIAASFPDVLGVFHSYTGNYEVAKKVLDIGWGLGVNGIITYPSARELRGVYKQILGQVSQDWTPADFYKRGIYFESDAPFLPPQEKRGQRNEPANVIDVFLFMLGISGAGSAQSAG